MTILSEAVHDECRMRSSPLAAAAAGWLGV